MDEAKAAFAAFIGFAVACLQMAMLANLLTALIQRQDLLAALLFQADGGILLVYALAIALAAVPVFLVFRAAFLIFQIRHWIAYAFGGAVAAVAGVLVMGGVKEALAFAIAGAVAGNLYREGETLVRGFRGRARAA